MKKFFTTILIFSSFIATAQVFNGTLLENTKIEILTPSNSVQGTKFRFVKFDIQDNEVAKKIYNNLGLLVGTKAGQIPVQTDGSIIQRHMNDNSITCLAYVNTDEYRCFLDVGK